MKILLLKENHIYEYNLPKTIKDNYWINDLDSLGNRRNLINVEARDGKWIMISNYETRIVSTSQNFEQIELTEYNFYTIKNDSEDSYYYVYCLPSKNYELLKLKMIGQGSLVIGNSPSANIVYNYPLVDQAHAKLTFNGSSWIVEDNNSKMGTYVNDVKIERATQISNGDTVFLCGLTLITINDIIVINKIGNLVGVNSPSLTNLVEQKENLDTTLSKEEELDRNLYDKDDFYYRSPRFIEDLVKEEFEIEDPPAPQLPDKTPLILTIGPMFTMSISSLSTILVTLNNISTGQATWESSAVSIIVSVAMFVSMLIWPIASKLWENKKQKKNEKERVKKYSEYLKKRTIEIQQLITKQSQILKDKYIGLDECANIIVRKRPNLWERGLNQSDFLTLRLGMGTRDIEADIKYSKERFALEVDQMKTLVTKLAEENNKLHDVPITMSFVEKNITAIVSQDDSKYHLVESLFLQMMTFHSYEMLRVAVLTTKENEKYWDFLKNSPYIFDDSHQIRYFATDMDETKETSLNLEKIFSDRKTTENYDFKNDKCYYVVFTDNYHIYRDIEIINDILKRETNIGFSLIILNDKLPNLPSECKNFISAGPQTSGIFESEISQGHKVEFRSEFVNPALLRQCVDKISNIPIEFDSDEKKLPTLLSFLELYDVGKVEQLNVAGRWETNNSKKTLAAPIGIEKSGTVLKLDLHEKFHGPHGLIAGMTGSGKSEFIITYILSMAVNYSPEDVAFILIDYKGGGLAGAFENREKGIRLPHLAGTITNLDTQEINRSLASIQSELRRRQGIFNEARDMLGESTVDIYKYQQFYKEGKVKEAVPHLLIISDEFAELKAQQPDFMDQLISTARIGRSLGVHLILATQKPSGVVNDQIWSNSRFRVCLKVQDKGDSQEMIKCPDAAMIKNAGRFYLQVGYNELFALGQSGWAGAQYFPKEKLRKRIDQSLVVIDNMGTVLSTQGEEDMKVKEQKSQGEEIASILNHIIEVSKSKNMKAKPLWLPKLLPEIFYEAAVNEYSYKETPYMLNPLIGLYDDPNNQKQGIVTIPFNQDGNELIYGSSGSGKELLLTTMIYSLITNHTSEELNLYICDFGAGTLNSFSNAPHVGNVCLSNDEEKVENLFKMLSSEIETRKKLFASYNGDYLTYIKNSGNKVPYIIVIINNYDAFQDLYDYNDTINVISRECEKYGIYMVMTLNSISSLRYKTKQNFKSNICLQFNDQDDYSAILGNTHKLFPSENYGRGLVKMEDIFEFQTLLPTKLDDLQKLIFDTCTKLAGENQPKAKNIPILPDKVKATDLVSNTNSLVKLPIGYNKDAVSIEYFNFINNFMTPVSSQDIENTVSFMDSLIYIGSKITNTNVIVFDMLSTLKSKTEGNVVVSSNSELLDKFILETETLTKIFKDNKENVQSLANYKKYLVIINGLDKFVNKLSIDQKTSFETMLNNVREMKQICFITLDNVNNYKKYEYEPWFKNSMGNQSGIWIGPGVGEQSAIRASIPYNCKYKNCEVNYGVCIKNTKPIFIKQMEYNPESKGVTIIKNPVPLKLNPNLKNNENIVKEALNKVKKDGVETI